MTAGDRDRELSAWLDEELGPLARRRVTRRLAADPAARAQVAFWRELGDHVRARSEAEAPAPDLWPALQARLPRTAPPPARRPLRAAAPWLGGLAAAAAALALAIGLWWGDAPAPGSLRWLDTKGKTAMVLQDDGEATIIFVMEPGPEHTSRRTAHAHVG